MIIKNEIKSFLRDKIGGKIYYHLYNMYLSYLNVPSEKAKQLAKFHKEGFYEFKLEDIDFPIYLNPNNGGVDAEIFCDGYFEDGILKLIKNNSNKESVFLDIGANIGQHSFWASHFFKKVYAFEPITPLFEQINKTLLRNDFFNIQVFNYGIGDKKEILPIYSNKSNMGASSILINENKEKKQDIKIISLDQEIEKIGIEKVDFIKIDVEGFEHNVLLGIQEIVKKYNPKILIEFSPMFYDKKNESISKKIYDYFIENGYEIFDVGNLGEKKIPIKDFSELKKDHQTNLFCIKK